VEGGSAAPNSPGVPTMMSVVSLPNALLSESMLVPPRPRERA
jgi:hypothetical protein